MDFDLPEPLSFCFELATLPVARVYAHSVLHMDLQKSFPMCCGHSIDAMLDQPPQVTVAHLQQKWPRYVKHLRLWQGQRPPAESKDGSTV